MDLLQGRKLFIIIVRCMKFNADCKIFQALWGFVQKPISGFMFTIILLVIYGCSFKWRILCREFCIHWYLLSRFVRIYAKCYACLCPESVQFKFLKVLLRTYSTLVLILVILLIHWLCILKLIAKWLTIQLAHYELEMLLTNKQNCNICTLLNVLFGVFLLTYMWTISGATVWNFSF